VAANKRYANESKKAFNDRKAKKGAARKAANKRAKKKYK
tara:strand:+ start:2014 stop:2130 length:117 start_codon:yes stop_codon:yes gene_type:complete